MRISDWSSDVCSSDLIAHSLGGTGTLLAAAEHGLAARRLAILAAPNHPRLFAAAMMAMLGLTPAQTAQVFTAIERLVGRSMESLHLPPKLRSLGIPGLILHSRDDRVVPLQHSRAEESRVGKACVSTGRSRWAPYN